MVTLDIYNHLTHTTSRVIVPDWSAYHTITRLSESVDDIHVTVKVMELIQ